MANYEIGSPDWADMAERGEWGFMEKMLSESIETIKPFNLSGLSVARDIAKARSKDGWRTYKSPIANQETVKNNNASESAMRHLGNVLLYFSDLYEGDRCASFQEAMDFYNAFNPDEIISGMEGFTTYLVNHGPLENSIGKLPPGTYCKGSWNLGTACGKCSRCLENAPEYIDGLEARIEELEQI